MLTRDFKLEIKALEDSGAFTGLAATYGNRDMVDDIIEPGSFKRAIAQQGNGYPLLWAHKSDEPLGLGRIEDSKDGLIVRGQLLMEDPVVQRRHAHMKGGTVRGLSIGFTIPRGEGKVSLRDDGVRILKEIHLHEISVVAVPANPLARITDVKSLADVRQVLTGLRAEQVDPEVLGDLHEIDRELKRLMAHDSEQQSDVLRELQTFAAELQRFAV